MTAFLAALVVVTNIGYTACYDTEIRSPLWVSYDLEPRMVVKGERKPFTFTKDPQIGEDSDRTDFYKRFGHQFDRGHLCPSADMCWNTNAQRQTFFFSNICPQVPKVNRGVWRETEEEVRNLAASGTVHVVIVPLDFSQGGYVPRRFVKVAYGAFGVRVWDIKNDSWEHEDESQKEAIQKLQAFKFMFSPKL